MSSAAEMREIAGQLLRLADEVDRAGGHGGERDEPHEGGLLAAALPSREGDPIYLVRLAEALLRIRRLRETHFDANLFADPAWDMLLDLFIQRSKGRRVAVTSICIASHVPPTTALRWLAIIEERGWVSREVDPSDRRRVFVGLSRQGEIALSKYLNAAARHVRLTHPVPFMLVDRVNS